MKGIDRLFDDSTDRAVSPVIGVILMVAITVILAAVIGTFVLNLSDQTGSAGPTAQLSASDAEDDFNSTNNLYEDFVTIDHNGGADLTGDSIRVVVRNSSDNSVVAEWDAGETSAGNANAANFTLNGDDFESSDTIGTGDSLTVAVNDTGSAPADNYDYVIQVIHPESEKQLVSSTVEVK